MKNLNIRKKLLSLAIFNTIALTSIPATVYAKEDINIEKDLEDINDYIIITKDTTIKEGPYNTSNDIETVKTGEPLKLISDIEGYYEIVSNGNIGYINKNNAKIESLDNKPYQKTVNTVIKEVKRWSNLSDRQRN